MADTPPLNRDSIIKGRGSMEAHHNFGGGMGGYSYRHLTFPRLSWLDKHGRSGPPPREWFVDGEKVGEGEEGLNAAIAALAVPVQFGEIEAAALSLLSSEFELLRAAEKRVGEELIARALAEPTDKPNRVGMVVFHLLRAKGAIELGRQETDEPNPLFPEEKQWRPTVRRVPTDG